MKYLIFRLSFILFFSLQAKLLIAQSNQYPVLAMAIDATAISADTSLGGLPALTDSTVFAATMNIDLFDTIGIDLIEIKLGSSQGSSDFLSKYFVFDDSGTFPDGTSFTRNDYTIHLGLGNFSGLTDYFSEIRIKRTDGTYTDPIYFNR